MYRALFALAAVLALQATSLHAGAECTAGNPNAGLAESTPTSALTDRGDGTVTHALTGLMWKRCPHGLSGANCDSGTAALLSWRAALASSVTDTTGGHSDWRLPNKNELESIVETCGHSPAINQTMFPATPGSIGGPGFWSGTSWSLLLDFPPYFVWVIDFHDGAMRTPDKAGTRYVRLVRSGRLFDEFDAQHPTSVVVSLNADANSVGAEYDALTDGLLVFRYLFGLTGPSLTAGAIGETATRNDPTEIMNYLDGIDTSLDVDRNGTTDALTDGLLIIRYLFGLRGSSLVAGAVDALGQRTSVTDIEMYIQSLMP